MWELTHTNLRTPPATQTQEPEVTSIEFIQGIRDVMRYHNAIFEIRVFEDGFLVSFEAMVRGCKVSVFREVSFSLSVEMKAVDFYELTCNMAEELNEKVGSMGK